jgi:hypothetical protein
MDPSSVQGGAPGTQAPPFTNLIGAGGGNEATPGTAPPPSAPSYTYVDNEGKFVDGWLEKAGFKDDPTLSTITSLPLLAKAFKETKGLVGKKLAVPSETSTPEEVAAWRKVTGAPETPEAYGSLMPEGFQKELWDAGLEKEFTALAHKHHLPLAAVKEIAAFQANGTKAIYEREVAAVQKQLETGKAELQKAWGVDYARHEANVKGLATYLGIPHEHDMFRDPLVMKAFAEKAPAFLGGDKIIQGQAAGVAGSINERLDAIRKGDDYQGKNGDARQKAAQTELQRLYAWRDGAKS